MIFQYPAALLLLLFLPPAAVFFVRRERTRQKALRYIGDVDLLDKLTVPVSPIRRLRRLALWLAAIALLIVALARPVWGVDVDIIETQGVAVLVALDVSNSMNARDVLPSRLERAKLGIRSLVNSLEGNEVGLILFAGTAFVQFPLTTDLTSAETFISAVSSQVISRQGTDIEAALRLAQQSFDIRRASQQIIVLVTDGENFEGDPVQAAEDAAQAGITIYTVGYGETRGEPIPVVDESGNVVSYKSAPSGDVVLSSLDANTLRAIAGRARGRYFHMLPDGQEMNDLTEQVRQHSGNRLENRIQSRGVERFAIFVALALLLLSLEMLLPETRRQRER